MIDIDAPILPAEGLGGLRLGVHIQEYEHLLSDEWIRRMVTPDFFRWEAKVWATVAMFEVRYELPPVAISGDARDGIVFKLGAFTPDYQGTFEGIRVGDGIGELLKRDDRLTWNDAEECVSVDGVSGIALLQPESDPAAEWIPHLYIDEIAVFLPERGLVPPINVWPPADAR